MERCLRDSRQRPWETHTTAFILLVCVCWFASPSRRRPTAVAPASLCSPWLATHYPVTLSAALARDLLLRVEREEAQQSLSVAPEGRAAEAARPYFDIVVIVPTPLLSDRRRFVRKHVFARPPFDFARIKLLFIVGGQDVDIDALEAVAGNSAAREDDVLVARHCRDEDGVATYPTGSATTCKVLAGIVHATASFRFALLIRSGDDSYVRIDMLLSRIIAAHLGGGLPRAARNFILGWWYRPDDNSVSPLLRDAYGISKWPTYPMGMGYVLGGNVTRALARLQDDLGLLDGYPEDAVVGMWLSGLSHDTVTRVHSPCFINDRVDSGCSDDAVLVHYMTPEKWARIDAQGRPRLCAGREVV